VAEVARLALVSGGGRGIGRAIALGLAVDGWSLAVLGRTQKTLDETAAACREAGSPEAVGVVADVTDPVAVRSAVARVTEQLGRVDLLVANAGLREDRPTTPWQADPDDWWRVVETNLRGVHLLDSAVLPSMVERGSGRVLHVGSGMGYETYPEWSAYGASKAALARLTDATAAALAGTGVTLLEVSPGLVRTDMTEQMWGPAEEQPWAPAELMVGVVRRFANGELDALHGRFVHARRDDLVDLVARAEQVRAAEARTLRLRPYGPDDPLA
jgi:NAD(P)-dependent dehydrogenase (short-subunit alcohol dehydrogenase family)